MNIRPYRDADWREWLRLSLALFPEYSENQLAPGMRELRTRTDAEVFVAERASGLLAGFVEVGSRPYADGCDDSRLDNQLGQAAHRGAGYEEVDRIVQFRKLLNTEP